MINIFARAKEKVTRSGAWPLDLPLVRCSKHPEDAWTLSDAFQGVRSGSKGQWQDQRLRQLLARMFLESGLVLYFNTDEADLAGLPRSAGACGIAPWCRFAASLSCTVMLRRLRSLIDNVSSM